MTEDTVVKEFLTEQMIDAGEKLATKLVARGLPLSAALWIYVPEINDWRLLFASKKVEEEGPLSVYRKIQEALEILGDEVKAAPFEVIKITDSRDQLIPLSQVALKTNKDVKRLRFSKNTIHGHYIEDALIYRCANTTRIEEPLVISSEIHRNETLDRETLVSLKVRLAALEKKIDRLLVLVEPTYLISDKYPQEEQGCQ